MLKSVFGYQLRTGASVIAIVNLISSIICVVYFTWQYNLNYGYSPYKPSEDSGHNYRYLSNSSLILRHEVLLFYIFFSYVAFGCVSIFANFGLRRATIKNEVDKIYLWLIISYVMLTMVIISEIIALIEINILENKVLMIICIAVDAILVFQLLVVQSFYAEEKLIEETNYSKLHSELVLQNNQQEEDEFQNVEL